MVFLILHSGHIFKCEFFYKKELSLIHLGYLVNPEIQSTQARQDKWFILTRKNEHIFF